MERKLLNQKSEYVPQSPMEEFIVPLLKEHICREIYNIHKVQRGINLKCLDVGCGNQPFRQQLEDIGYNYNSLDVIQNKLNNVDHIAQLDNDLPESLHIKAPFDLLLCTEVLEHIADWNKVFANFYSLLKPGGAILITCPHFYVLHEQPYDYWRPTIHALRYYANRYSFQELSSSTAGNAWDVIGTILGSTTIYMKDYSVYTKILYRIVKYLKIIIFKKLKSRELQNKISLVNDNFPTYLSNIIVLARQ